MKRNKIQMISIENTGHLNFIFHKQLLRYLTQHGN